MLRKSLLLFAMIFGTTLFINIEATHAQDNQQDNGGFGDFESSGTIFGGDSIDALACQNNALTKVVGILVNYITAGIVIIGLIMIVISGYIYMTAGGNAERVSTAKSFLTSSLVAITIALTAYLVLNTISPQFAENAKDPTIPGQQVNCN